MTIDLLNGREMPAYGRAIVPIVGRFCTCQHNHNVSSYDTTTNPCPSCPCASFVKASA